MGHGGPEAGRVVGSAGLGTQLQILRRIGVVDVDSLIDYRGCFAGAYQDLDNPFEKAVYANAVSKSITGS